VRRLVATGGSDGYLKFWDVRTGDTPVSAVKLEGRVWAMDHADDTLVLATSDARISIFKMHEPAKPFRVRMNHRLFTLAVVFMVG
jgi:WD40 repeat protein